MSGGFWLARNVTGSEVLIVYASDEAGAILNAAEGCGTDAAAAWVAVRLTDDQEAELELDE